MKEKLKLEKKTKRKKAQAREAQVDRESLTDLTVMGGRPAGFRSGLQPSHEHTARQKERKPQTDQALTVSEWREGRNKEMPFALPQPTGRCAAQRREESCSTGTGMMEG